MVMEPVVLVCEGCGVRIRTSDPARARGRDCPRCSTPLATVVDQALGFEPGLDPVAQRASTKRLMTGTLAVLVTIGSLASLAVRGDSHNSATSRSIPGGHCVQVEPRPSPTPAPEPGQTETPVNPQPERTESESTDPVPVPELTSTPGSRPEGLAILESDRLAPDAFPEQPREALPRPEPFDIAPPPPLPVLAPAIRTEPRRVFVRDAKGKAIVAREHGMLKGRMAVLLPDGQIGWPEGLVFTDQPFVPSTIDQLRRSLLDDPEFATFRVHQTSHYLIFYQSSEHFAEASADLLERLFDGLTAALKKHGLPVAPLEFPLVAVIFATEDDFRANRRVASDVQAYYEILSNRIFFYEKSRRDQDSPEVSALRKPQTVAHEGTHQILHNVGIQPRLSDWPLWLVEGLAEYCSPPKVTRKGTDWAGLGQVNPIHMATIRDLEDPLPNQVRGGPRDSFLDRDHRSSTVEYLVTKQDLNPTDYARAWALTHYLATQRLDEFVAYVKRLSRKKPFEELSPEEHLATFRQAFGNDLAQMDTKIGKYVRKLKQADALPYLRGDLRATDRPDDPPSGHGQPVPLGHPPVARLGRRARRGPAPLAVHPPAHAQEGCRGRRGVGHAGALRQRNHR